MPKTISFEQNMWGHAFHASSFTKLPERDGWLNRWRDRRISARRFSVLVHSREFPEPGDLIRYPAASGGVATAQVERVEQMRDPDDMFKLFLLRDRSIDEQHNMVSA